VTFGDERGELLGEALCIPLGVKLGNVTLARWLGVELDVAEGDRECVTLGSYLEESIGEDSAYRWE
jgi:hypothetical protein